MFGALSAVMREGFSTFKDKYSLHIRQSVKQTYIAAPYNLVQGQHADDEPRDNMTTALVLGSDTWFDGLPLCVILMRGFDTSCIIVLHISNSGKPIKVHTELQTRWNGGLVTLSWDVLSNTRWLTKEESPTTGLCFPIAGQITVIRIFIWVLNLVSFEV